MSFDVLGALNIMGHAGRDRVRAGKQIARLDITISTLMRLTVSNLSVDEAQSNVGMGLSNFSIERALTYH